MYCYGFVIWFLFEDLFDLVYVEFENIYIT